MEGARPRVYDKWKLPRKMQRSLKILGIAARRARGPQKRAVNLPSVRFPIRFDTRVKMHELHPLQAPLLAMLHGAHQDAALRQTLRFDQIQKYYRTSQKLRNCLNSTEVVRQSDRAIETYSENQIRGLLVQRRLELLREGLE